MRFRTVLIWPTKDGLQTEKISNTGKAYYFHLCPSRISRPTVKVCIIEIYMAFLDQKMVTIWNSASNRCFKQFLKVENPGHGGGRKCCGKTKRLGRPPNIHVGKRILKFIPCPWKMPTNGHWEKGMPALLYRPVIYYPTPLFVGMQTSPLFQMKPLEKRFTFQSFRVWEMALW